MNSNQHSVNYDEFSHITIGRVIHILQEHADRHGELIDTLLITSEQLRQCWQHYQQSQEIENERSRFRLNLFNDSSQENLKNSDPHFANSVWQYWVDHLHQQMYVQGSDEPELTCKPKICQWLIECGLQTGLKIRLQTALAPYQHNSEASIACAVTVLNEFISWLGYIESPPQHRPKSRINHHRAIFSGIEDKCHPPTFCNLADEPGYINATYIGDWIVALHSRVTDLSARDPKIASNERNE